MYVYLMSYSSLTFLTLQSKVILSHVLDWSNALYLKSFFSCFLVPSCCEAGFIKYIYNLLCRHQAQGNAEWDGEWTNFKADITLESPELTNELVTHLRNNGSPVEVLALG